VHIQYVNITYISELSSVAYNKQQFNWCSSIHYENWD